VSATVLLVEDEPDIRLMTSFMLEGAGHRVVEAGTGTEALEALGRERPDLVVLDIRLPDMEGWEVLNAVRSSERLEDVPVLVVSAHSSGDARERASREGGSGYLTKPFREVELLEQVDALVGPRAR
jgi:CheY-like chemotaxis protein